MKLPELLAPAGSPEALAAAIEGGADAIYLGSTAFNARIHAHNFDETALMEAVSLAHKYGVKIYETLNTLVLDKEMKDFLHAAEVAANCGVDALIVADLGASLAIHRAIPSLPLHASTQLSAHNADAGKLLADYGFSRMVIARETSLENMKTIVKESPIEIEAFIHGALCVCHSGQCLFSSMIGGRSGNRGECAQPCRLPYGNERFQQDKYPLSLKDLSLCQHIPELIDSGVTSLKIEGRMKSPEYVYTVTKIWRKLLDEGRNATKEELNQLSSTFSRSGFTDGYFTGNINHKMVGIRTTEDKEMTKTLSSYQGLTKKIPLDFRLVFKRNQETSLTVSIENTTHTVIGEKPLEAIHAPMGREELNKSLSKLGNTPYTLRSFTIDMDEGLMMPVSKLNDLRRRALQTLEEKLPAIHAKEQPLTPQKQREGIVSARFYDASQITDKAKSFFDRTYLPLHKYNKRANGVILPPVIFDSEKDEVRHLLQEAIEQGAKYALVGNLGHLDLVRNTSLIPVGDYRFNVFNKETVANLEALGLDEILLSPELTLPQLRDCKGNSTAIIYGRIPLMTLEKCVISEVSNCNVCQKDCGVITDRKNAQFPVLREYEHRNVIYNSIPTYMLDRKDELMQYRLTNTHFIFSVEKEQEVDKIIDAYNKGKAANGQARRIAK